MRFVPTSTPTNTVRVGAGRGSPNRRSGTVVGLDHAVVGVIVGSAAVYLHETLQQHGAFEYVPATLESTDPAGAPAQPLAGATYAAKIRKDEARIDWSKSASDVHNHIRGLSPFPGAWFELGGQRIKALNAVGATPQDLLAILQAMKAAGALKAELQII